MYQFKLLRAIYKLRHKNYDLFAQASKCNESRKLEEIYFLLRFGEFK